MSKSPLSREQLIVDYEEKNAMLELEFGEHVTPHDFYREIFPIGWLQDSFKKNPAAPHDGKFVAIANVTFQSKAWHPYHRNRYVTDDLSQLHYWKNMVAYMAPCSFLGGAKDTKHLRYMHALVVDLDYVKPKNLRDWLYQVQSGWIPRPTFVVNSGTGIHPYYVLDEPFCAYPNLQPGLKCLKDALCDVNWNGYTSLSSSKQYSGLVQPYRIPGTRTKLDVSPKYERVWSSDYDVVAFRSGDKWAIDDLLNWRPALLKSAPDYVDPWVDRAETARRMLHPELDPDHVTLDMAKERWPEWFDARILRGEPLPPLEETKWHVDPAVYEWWLRTIKEPGNAVVGRRYFCVMMLAVYARKCDIPKRKLNEDAYALLPMLEEKTIEETNHFHRSDINQALVAYDNIESVKMPIELIEHLSGVRIERNRRNGRSQAEHVRRMSVLRDLDYPDGSWRGRKPKRDLIRAYAAEHPEANHSEIARALGVSRPTVIKWLKNQLKPNEQESN